MKKILLAIILLALSSTAYAQDFRIAYNRITGEYRIEERYVDNHRWKPFKDQIWVYSHYGTGVGGRYKEANITYNTYDEAFKKLTEIKKEIADKEAEEQRTRDIENAWEPINKEGGD